MPRRLIRTAGSSRCLSTSSVRHGPRRTSSSLSRRDLNSRGRSVCRRSGEGARLMLAQLAAPTGEGAKAGPIALLVILLLCIACYFLFRSMTKHLKKVREEFPGEPPPEPPSDLLPEPPAEPPR